MDQYVIIKYETASRSAVKLNGMSVLTVINFLDRIAAESLKPSHYDRFSKGYLIVKLNALGFGSGSNKLNNLDEYDFLKIFEKHLDHPGMKILLEYRPSSYSFRADIHKKYGVDISKE